MPRLNPTRYWVLLSLIPLSGCMGGSIAQQVASSIISHVADQKISDAYDARLLRQAEENRYQHAELKDTQPDEYWAAFVTSGFRSIQPIEEPATNNAEAEQPPIKMIKPTRDIAANAYPAALLQGNQLVQVEVWGMILGEEKQATLEKARLMGATGLPPESEWRYWQMASGAMNGENSQQVIFLIPPDFGKIRSGSHTVVEIAGAGEISIARYLASN